jgi:hypothetical protein
MLRACKPGSAETSLFPPGKACLKMKPTLEEENRAEIWIIRDKFLTDIE